MAFTNVYDNTFPPDTQLANLLGLDLRNIRLDMQERMAAISGLDAAKPAFSADTQPAKWNGVLFFATDTGKIYQFNNPAWTDVTAGFIKSNTIFRDGVAHVNTGNTTNNTIYTVNVPALVAQSQLRIRICMTVFKAVGANAAVFVTFNGVAITNLPLINGQSYASNGTVMWDINMSNRGATGSQVWYTEQGPANLSNSNIGGGGAVTSAVDTTSGRVLLVTCQNGVSADSITFDICEVELL